MNESLMTISCAVARDLMGVEGGARYPDATGPILRRHIEGCPACAALYAEMRQAVAMEAIGEAAAEDFRRRAKKLKRTNPLRVSLKAAALALAALLLVGAGVLACLRLNGMQFDVPLDQYSVELRQSPGGVPYFHAEVGAEAFSGRFWYAGFEHDDSAVASSGVCRIGCFKSLRESVRLDDSADIEIDFNTAMFLRGGKLYAYRYFDNGRNADKYTLLGEITEIRKACRNSRGYETVWRAGDDIPVFDGYAPYGLTPEQIDALFFS